MLLKVVVTSSGGHGDGATKLFSGQKCCYDGQLPLTSCYFKRYCNLIQFYFLIIVNWFYLEMVLYIPYD